MSQCAGDRDTRRAAGLRGRGAAIDLCAGSVLGRQHSGGGQQPDGGLVRADPARGDALIVYATGMGRVLQDPARETRLRSGQPPTLLPVQVSLQSGGNRVTVVPAFAGLAPGLIGVYQINVTVPQNAPTGNVE